MTGTSVMKELMLCYSQIFIEIYFFYYDKIIDLYTSKYRRSTLLINPLNGNKTVETFNARKTYKAYIDFGIFNLKIFVLLQLHFLCISNQGQALTLKVAYIFKVFGTQSCLMVAQQFDQVTYVCKEFNNFQNSNPNL